MKKIRCFLFVLLLATLTSGIGCRGRVPAVRLPAGLGRAAVRLPVPPKVPLRAFRPKLPVAEPVRPFAIKAPVAEPGLPSAIKPTGPELKVKPSLVEPAAVQTAKADLLKKLQVQAAAGAWKSVRNVAQEALDRGAAGAPEWSGPLAALRKQSGKLEASQTLGRAIGGDWAKAPETKLLEEALGNLPPALGGKVRKYLVCRARLEGQTGVARTLQPDGELPDAATLLRDLKALAAEPPAVPPPLPTGSGVNLGPEGPEISLRPQVREALGVDLPELAQLPGAEKAARARVRGNIQADAHLAWHQLRIQVHFLTERHAPPVLVKRDENEDPKAEAVVQRLLGRNLQPEERILVRHLHGKKTPAELAQILK